MIEPTDEMKAAVAKRMGVPDGAAPDPWMEPAIQDVLNIVERDYQLVHYCNNELMPGVVCKRLAINPCHKHLGMLPNGSRAEWT